MNEQRLGAGRAGHPTAVGAAVAAHAPTHLAVQPVAAAAGALEALRILVLPKSARIVTGMRGKAPRGAGPAGTSSAIDQKWVQEPTSPTGMSAAPTSVKVLVVGPKKCGKTTICNFLGQQSKHLKPGPEYEPTAGCRSVSSASAARRLRQPRSIGTLSPIRGPRCLQGCVYRADWLGFDSLNAGSPCARSTPQDSRV